MSRPSGDGPDLVTRTHLFLTEIDAEARTHPEPEPTTEHLGGHADDTELDEYVDLDTVGEDRFVGEDGFDGTEIAHPEGSGHDDAYDDDDDAYDDDDDAYDDTLIVEPAPPDPASPDDDETHTAPARFSKPTVIAFAAATAVVTIGLSAAMVAMRSDRTVVSDQTPDITRQVAVVAGPTTTEPPQGTNAGGDAPIPFTASADCPLGSTAAQAVAGTDPTRAWVCVRAGADGQVLTINLGRPMKVTAVSIVPGWAGTDASGADQWLQHRVVTRVQWILINGDQRIPVQQNTNNVHGEAPQQMPGNGPDRGVLASSIQMIVQQTSRAPADTPLTNPEPGSSPGQSGGLLNDVLGGPLGGAPTPATSNTAAPMPGGTVSDSANADPADNTFAVSSIKIIGHLPQ